MNKVINKKAENLYESMKKYYKEYMKKQEYGGGAFAEMISRAKALCEMDVAAEFYEYTQDEVPFENDVHQESMDAEAEIVVEDGANDTPAEGVKVTGVVKKEKHMMPFAFRK